MDTEKLVNTYLLYFVGKQEKDRWTWDEVDDLVRRDPERWCALMRKYGFADGKRTPL